MVVRGPSNFEAWLSRYGILRPGLIYVDLINLLWIDAYTELITDCCSRFGHARPILYNAAVRCRLLHMELEAKRPGPVR